MYTKGATGIGGAIEFPNTPGPVNLNLLVSNKLHHNGLKMSEYEAYWLTDFPLIIY